MVKLFQVRPKCWGVSNTNYIMYLSNIYVHVWQMSSKDPQWLVVVCSPEANCPVMATWDKIVAMCWPSDIPNWPYMSSVHYQTGPTLERPQPYCKTLRIVSKNVKHCAQLNRTFNSKMTKVVEIYQIDLIKIMYVNYVRKVI